MVETHDVLIVGAGPAGLCVAYELSKRGVASVLLEKGARPGWSWANMPDSITVLSPWKRNVMNGTRFSFTEMHKQHPVFEYHQYLCQYARDNNLDVRLGHEVKIVRKEHDQFIVETNSDTFSSPILINATGYFGNPYVPTIEGLDDSLPMLHVHDFKSATRLREVYGPELKKILVVGGRVSAGQTATELADAEGYQVDLCLRQPLKFSRDPWLQRLSFWVYYQIEDFRARVNPNGVDDTNPPMEGGRTRRLIQAGRIGTRPEIAKINGKEVRFIDGTLEHYDLIIFCTGFRPVLGHLEKLLPQSTNAAAPALAGMESIDAPGLFFIGLDKLTNFRSRYLRGIREDAVVLADTIAGKIKP